MNRVGDPCVIIVEVDPLEPVSGLAHPLCYIRY